MADVLEEHARRVELGFGVTVSSFWDPPQALGGSRRWRVGLPSWFPSGSWLEGEHGYETLADAVGALEQTGALEAVEELWRARSAESAARHKAFSKIMAAHVRRDKSYDELVRARHARARAAAGGLADEIAGGHRDRTGMIADTKRPTL